DAELREKTYELVQKFFQRFPALDMVSVQPILGPVGDVYYTLFKFSEAPKPLTEQSLNEPAELPEIRLVVQREDMVAKTRNVHSYPLTDQAQEDFADKLAKELRHRITNEILTDLRNNA